MGLLRRLLLGSGRMPEEVRSALAGDDVLLLEEGLPGSVTYRDFRSPGRASNRKQAMDVTAEHDDRVCIAYDAPDDAKWSGRVELRFRTARADRISELFAAAR